MLLLLSALWPQNACPSIPRTSSTSQTGLQGLGGGKGAAGQAVGTAGEGSSPAAPLLQPHPGKRAAPSTPTPPAPGIPPARSSPALHPGPREAAARRGRAERPAGPARAGSAARGHPLPAPPAAAGSPLRAPGRAAPPRAPGPSPHLPLLQQPSHVRVVVVPNVLLLGRPRSPLALRLAGAGRRAQPQRQAQQGPAGGRRHLLPELAAAGRRTLSLEGRGQRRPGRGGTGRRKRRRSWQERRGEKAATGASPGALGAMGLRAALWGSAGRWRRLRAARGAAPAGGGRCQVWFCFILNRVRDQLLQCKLCEVFLLLFSKRGNNRLRREGTWARGTESSDRSWLSQHH